MLSQGVRGGEQLDLGLAVHEVVIGLQRDGRRHVELPAQMPDVRDVPGAHVGEPPLADLALADQVAEGGNGLLPGRVGIDAVRVVEIDVVGLQALQAGLDRAHHVAAG